MASGICGQEDSFITRTNWTDTGSCSESRFLHVGSSHAAKVLLKNGQNVPHGGGERLRIQHPQRTAALEDGEKGFMD